MARQSRRAASSWIWQTSLTAVTALPAASIVAFELFVLPDDATDETLFRTIASLYAGKTAISALGPANIEVGFIVSQQRAVAAGVAALPRPIEEAEQEWIFRGKLIVPRSTAADTIIQSDKLELDIKSRRRLNSTENLVLLFENLEAFAIEVTANVSVLSKATGT